MDFIYEIENVLPKEICDAIIQRYRSDSRQYNSKIGGEGSINDKIRKSKILSISRLSDWKDVDRIIFDVINRGLKKYKKHIIENCIITTDDVECIHGQIESFFGSLRDEGYHIQEYKKDDFYSWHMDSVDGLKRSISCILYLNSLNQDQGGYTEFMNGKKIKPETGKLLFFPSDWKYVHRSSMIKDDVAKYTIITWLN